jgi:hypothetical protein
MLPTSVDPRAKKKRISRQPPLVYSFSVIPVLWRFSITGAAEAKVLRSRVNRVVFMVVKGEAVALLLGEVGLVRCSWSDTFNRRRTRWLYRSPRCIGDHHPGRRFMEQFELTSFGSVFAYTFLVLHISTSPL